MLHKYLEIASTPAVKAARQRYGSESLFSRIDGTLDPQGSPENNHLGPEEKAFIAARDGFYLASVSETGWPYVQYRGGPPGFLKILDDQTLGFADFRGNRQYVTTGNVAGNDKISLFLMDYARQARLKIFGRIQVVDSRIDQETAAAFAVKNYQARVERAVSITVEAFDWNCPQHITRRFTEAEINDQLGPLRIRLQTLEIDNARLRAQALAAG